MTAGINWWSSDQPDDSDLAEEDNIEERFLFTRVHNILTEPNDVKDSVKNGRTLVVY